MLLSLSFSRTEIRCQSGWMSITLNGTWNTKTKVIHLQQSKGNITKDFRAHTRPALRAKKARPSKKGAFKSGQGYRTYNIRPY